VKEVETIAYTTPEEFKANVKRLWIEEKLFRIDENGDIVVLDYSEPVK